MAKKNKKNSNVSEELRYIVSANVGIIKITAFIFDFLAIPPCCCQSLIICPNILWFSNHCSNRLEDLAKNHAAASIDGVVGIPGTKTPTNPSPTKNTPSVI